MLRYFETYLSPLFQKHTKNRMKQRKRHKRNFDNKVNYYHALPFNSPEAEMNDTTISCLHKIIESMTFNRPESICYCFFGRLNGP